MWKYLKTALTQPGWRGEDNRTLALMALSNGSVVIFSPILFLKDKGGEPDAVLTLVVIACAFLARAAIRGFIRQNPWS